MKKLTIALSIIIGVYLLINAALFGYVKMTESNIESNKKSLEFYSQQRMETLTIPPAENLAERAMHDTKLITIQSKISMNQQEYFYLMKSYQDKKFLLYKLSFGVL